MKTLQAIAKEKQIMLTGDYMEPLIPQLMLLVLPCVQIKEPGMSQINDTVEWLLRHNDQVALSYLMAGLEDTQWQENYLVERLKLLKSEQEIAEVLLLDALWDAMKEHS